MTVVNRRIAAVSALWLALFPLLAGCWDRREINDIAIVLGTAVDKEGEMYRTTLQIALPGQMSGTKGGGGGTTGRKNWLMVSDVAETPKFATFKGQQMMSRLVNLSHRRVFIIGEKVARDGIQKLLDTMARDPDNRLTTLVLVAEGRADRVLNIESSLELVPAEAIREEAALFQRHPPTLKDVANILYDPGKDPMLPCISIAEMSSLDADNTNKAIRLDKLAVFRDDRLVGIADGELRDGLLLASGQSKDFKLLVPAPEGEGNLNVIFHHYAARLQPIFERERIRMRIIADGYGTVVENNSNFFMHRPEGIKKVEQAVNDAVRNRIEKAVRWLREKKSDAVGFGRAIHVRRPQEWHRMRKNWREEFSRADVEVVTMLDVENFGYNRAPFGKREEELR